MHCKKNIVLLYGISFLQGMVFYGSIATLYRQQAGVSIFQITVIESISLALCVLLEVPWGFAADKFGYRNTLVFCCGLYFVSKLVFWQAQGFGAFLLERLLLSVVLAGMSGVDTSVLYLCADAKNAQHTFGVYNNLSTAGLLLSAGVYALFLQSNYRLAALFTVGSYGVAAVLALFLQEVPAEKPAHGASKPWQAVWRQLAANPRRILLCVAVALLSETHQTITVFLSQLQYVRCGASAAAIGWTYLGVTLAGFLGGCSARLTRRLGVKRSAVLLFAACITACIVLAATGSFVVSAAAVLLLRISFSLFTPLQLSLQNYGITHNRATALSINALWIDAVAIASNLTFGKIADTNLPVAIAFGALLCGVGLVLFCIWYKIAAPATEPFLTNQFDSEQL